MGEFKKYLAEFIGTYTLVFCGTGAIVMNDVSGGVVSHLGVAICFGIVVMAMIYSFGSISGAHINPAVTLAFYFSKRFPKQLVGGYITAQIIGAILASFTLKMLFPTHETLGITLPFDGSAQTFVLEVILTFFLMLVIIFTSTGSKETGTLAGLAIGGVVLMEALFAGPITGASMNPARSIGPALVSGRIEELWIYILAPILGALLAIMVWKVFNTQATINYDAPEKSE